MFDKDSDYFITRRKKRGKIAEIPSFLCLLAVGRQFFTRFLQQCRRNDCEWNTAATRVLVLPSQVAKKRIN